MLSLIVIALITAGAAGFVTRDRSARVAGAGYSSGGYPGDDVYRGRYPGDGFPGERQQPAAEPARIGQAEARAEASHWIDLLGAGLTRLDGAASAADTDGTRQHAVRFALSDAAERHSAAIQQLARAEPVHEIELAARTALEGLHYLRAARTALRMDPGPAVPASSTTGELTGSRRVVVQGTEYEASDQPGQRTPHYYPGGTVRGRNVPAGWYSTPWWKTALVAGTAGIGSLLVADALFGHGQMFGAQDGFSDPLFIRPFIHQDFRSSP